MWLIESQSIRRQEASELRRIIPASHVIEARLIVEGIEAVCSRVHRAIRARDIAEGAVRDRGDFDAGIIGKKLRVAGLVRVNEIDSRWPENSRSEEHTSELQSRQYLVCRLLLEKKKR